MADDRAALLFDADCGFCRWATARLLRWDRSRRLRPVPLQSAEADLLLATVPKELRGSSWHLVRDGRVRSAGRAVSPLLRMLPGGRVLAAVAEAFPGGTDASYAWVARHRGLLGRIVGQKACSVMPSAPRS
ncbi:MAG: thiol-disulfide oxidoreductase DCC family protein [Actinomycetota bacterium]